MVVYCDTSFLIPLYIDQDQSSEALDIIESFHESLLFTSFQRFEFINAVRLCFFRKEINAHQCQEILDQMEKDSRENVFQHTPLSWMEVFREAERLSAFHTGYLGNRGLDILHVAGALTLKTDIFLTFDSRQCKLAKKVGLKVKP